MAEGARAEFRRDLKPIEKVFQTHSAPEMYTPNVATDDERYYVPLSETVGTRHFKVKGPLIWLDEKGDVVAFFDVHQYIDICKEHCDKVGLGADYIDTLMR